MALAAALFGLPNIWTLTRKAMLRPLLLTLALIVSANASALCLDGRNPSVQEEFRDSDVVVFGTVLAERTVSSPEDPEGFEETIYRFSPSRVFKGGAPRYIDLHSSNTSSRFPMTPGETYVVFARSTRDGFFIDSCGNSVKAGEDAKLVSDVAALARTSATSAKAAQ
jgi:hypothetical protein